MTRRLHTSAPSPLKLALVIAVVCAMGTSFGLADTVIADEMSGNQRRQRHRSGMIVEIRPDDVLILADDGATWKIASKDLRSIALSSTEPRTGEWTNENGDVQMIKVISRDGKLLFSNDKGKVVIPPLKPKSLARIRIYPTGEQAIRLDVPYVPQKADFSGEAAVEMATNFFGTRISQDEVNRAAGLNGLRGVRASELEKTLTKLHVPFARETSFVVPRDDADAHLIDLMRIIAELPRERPVLIAAGDVRGANPKPQNGDLFLLLIGVDIANRELLVYDPAKSFATKESGDAARRMSFDDFYACRSTASSFVFSLTFTPPARPGDKKPASRPAGRK